MTITFVSSSNGDSGTTTLTQPKPAGAAAGDLILMPLVFDTEGNTHSLTGFDVSYDEVQTGPDTLQGRMLSRTLTEADNAVTDWTITGATVSKKCIASCFRSSVAGTWNISAPVPVSAVGACLVTPVPAPDNSMLVVDWFNDSQVAVISAPALMTAGPASISGVSVTAVSYHQSITTGASQSKSLTFASDGTLGVGYYLTFTPSASGDTITVTQTEVTDAGTISGTYTKTSEWTSSDPTEGTFDGVPLTGFSASGGNWSATAPSVMGIAAGLTYPTTAKVPSFGAGDVVIGDGSFNAAAVSRDFVAKSGFARVVFATVDESTADGLYLRINATVDPDRDIATNEAIYYDTVSGTVTVFDTGLYSMSGATDDFAFAIISATDDVDEDFEFNNLVDYDNPVMPVTAGRNVTVGTTSAGTHAVSEGTAPITYTKSGTDHALFSINSSTGALAYLVAPLVGDIGTQHVVDVTATNAGGSDTTTVTTTIVAESTGPVVNKLSISLSLGL